MNGREKTKRLLAIKKGLGRIQNNSQNQGGDKEIGVEDDSRTVKGDGEIFDMSTPYTDPNSDPDSFSGDQTLAQPNTLNSLNRQEGKAGVQEYDLEGDNFTFNETYQEPTYFSGDKDLLKLQPTSKSNPKSLVGQLESIRDIIKVLITAKKSNKIEKLDAIKQRLEALKTDIKTKISESEEVYKQHHLELITNSETENFNDITSALEGLKNKFSQTKEKLTDSIKHIEDQLKNIEQNILGTFGDDESIIPSDLPDNDLRKELESFTKGGTKRKRRRKQRTLKY